ncbi:MAG: GTP pyrophosphokinase family protein [Lachnospiraceae bacterium]|nr:GTP pyrophosphokinase family protein [Lachnospiraceae bacterium]
MDSIYGEYEQVMKEVLSDLNDRFNRINEKRMSETGEHLYEHIISRLKSDESMREKCRRKGLPEDTKSALCDLRDAIGVRVVCSFIDDIYDLVSLVRQFDGVDIIEEKDYIRHAKPNGYRSYHMILQLHPAAAEEMEIKDFYVEMQLRTIAMDSWASLEHKMKYKKDIRNQAMIESELKRCADELAGCDLSMQTIRDLIRQS